MAEDGTVIEIDGDDTKKNEKGGGGGGVSGEGEEALTVTKSGRVLKTRASAASTTTGSKRTHGEKSNDHNNQEGEQAGSGNGGNKNGKKKKGNSKTKEEDEDADGGAEADDNDWLCATCGMYEDALGSELLLCDGVCKRSFHNGCLSDKEKSRIDDALWYCDDCTEGMHKCLVCGKKGRDNFEVTKCKRDNCGQHYHLNCLQGNFIIEEGSRVVGNYKGWGKWYPGRVIKEREDGFFDVLYDDTEIELKVRPCRLRLERPGPNFIVPPISFKDKDLCKVIKPPKEETSSSSSAASSSSASSSSSSTSPSKKQTKHAPMWWLTEEEKDAAMAATTSETTAVSTAEGGSENSSPSKPPLVKRNRHLPTIKKGKNGEDIITTYSFECPRHLCDNCHQFYGKTKEEVFNCLLCPRAYHINCFPPGTRHNSTCVLCPLHPNEYLPNKNDIYRDTQPTSTRVEAKIWSRMTLPDEIPDPSDPLDNHYKLPLQFKDEASCGAPQFKMLSSNNYDLLPNKINSLPLHTPEETCVCVGVCGPGCLNRILKIECYSDKKPNEPQICHVGGDCTNRQFQNKEYSCYERFREHAMGWGLRATQHIKEGDLVIEYIGEVIDENEMRRRLETQRRDHPSDHDFYVMELDNGFYVDGKHKGNMSRFINHSCDPNCELERWVVKGHMRIGIFAIKDIKPGEPLSYDYQFDTMEAEHFKCYCGSENCRGTMAPRKKGDKNSLSRAERLKLVAAGRMREKKKTVAERMEEEATRSYTSKYLPGDNILEIIKGPVKQMFSYARRGLLFLPRNTRHTKNFKIRRAALWHRGEKVKALRRMKVKKA